MRLENISLIHFKNYMNLSLTFPADINCIVGINGSGKTNLLDAIHYLSLTKSAFNNIDSQNVLHGEEFFSIKGQINDENKSFQIQCNFQINQKKSVKLNQKIYLKNSEHIGKFPTVLIHPNDTDLIRGGSELRRKFFDAIISQFDAVYLNNLISYNQALKHRNSLLKQFITTKEFDKDIFEPYDKIILEIGRRIYLKRKSFINEFCPEFNTSYIKLGEHKEKTNIEYISHQSQQNFPQLFQGNFQKDIHNQRTSLGIHKDEYVFNIEDLPIKKFGSQGQQKSFIIALKLAQFDILKENMGTKPVMLLDDIFDKLDDLRIRRLINMLKNQHFGQIFITDARPERSATIMKDLNDKLAIFHIEGGELKNPEKNQ